MKNKLFIFSLILFSSSFLCGFDLKKKVAPDNGASLFLSNCSMCHLPNKSVVGPPFQGIRKDYPTDWIYAMVRNHDSFCNSSDIHARYISKVWENNRFSTVFDLNDEAISSILDYVDSKPFASDYYKHRKMSEKELSKLMEYIGSVPASDFELYQRVFDSVKKI